MNTVRSMPRLCRLLLAAIIIGSLVLVGDNLAAADQGHDHHADATPASAMAEQPRELIVVTVSEYGESFAIDISPVGILDQLHPGAVYDLMIVNAGGLAHELMVMPAGMAHMGHDDGDCSMALLCISGSELSHRGAEARTELVFPEIGDYTFICHMHAGMEVTVTVVS